MVALGIRRSYSDALVDALRAGRPQVFGGPSAPHTPIEISLDAEATRALAASMRSPDVRVRRLAFQLAADVPKAARPPDVAAGLDDADPIVRLAAVRALDSAKPAEREAVLRMIDDAEPSVAAAAAARAIGLGDDDRATTKLRELLEANDNDVAERPSSSSDSRPRKPRRRSPERSSTTPPSTSELPPLNGSPRLRLPAHWRRRSPG